MIYSFTLRSSSIKTLLDSGGNTAGVLSRFELRKFMIYDQWTFQFSPLCITLKDFIKGLTTRQFYTWNKEDIQYLFEAYYANHTNSHILKRFFLLSFQNKSENKVHCFQKGTVGVGVSISKKAALNQYYWKSGTISPNLKTQRVKTDQVYEWLAWFPYHSSTEPSGRK